MHARRRWERFSTREILQAERRMEAAAEGLAGGDRHRLSQAGGTGAAKAAERDGLALGAAVHPSGQERRAVRQR